MGYKGDMLLGEFLDLCSARLDEETGIWHVKIMTFDGFPLEGTVGDCGSEFEAKERFFLYLKEKLGGNKGGLDEEECY